MKISKFGNFLHGWGYLFLAARLGCAKISLAQRLEACSDRKTHCRWVDTLQGII